MKLSRLFLALFLSVAAAHGAENKSWYVQLGLGFSTSHLSGAGVEPINRATQRGNILQTNLDLPGVYVPLFHPRLLTGIAAGLGETEVLLFGSKEIEQVSFTLWRATLSHLYFLESDENVGMFLRLDVGPGHVVLTPGAHSEDFKAGLIGAVPPGTRTGFFFLTGVGWSFATTDRLRVLLQLNYSLVSLSSFRLGMFNGSVGFLF